LKIQKNHQNMSITISPISESSKWKWWLSLFAIALIALAMRWYYVSTAVVLDPVRGDAAQYYSYAWNMANHAIFSKDPPGSLTVSPDNYRDPGYPFFLAVWMKLLGAGDAWYAAVLLCQALLGALTVLLVTVIGRYWLPPLWAISAGGLMAAWPHSITINGYLLSETLFGFLCALGMLLCVGTCRNLSAWRGFGAGLAFGAAALTNAILLPFSISLAAFLLWRKYVNRKIFFSIALGALLLPAAWSVRNRDIAPSTDGNSSRDRALLNLVLGTWPEFQASWRESFFGDSAQKKRAQEITLAYQKEYLALKQSPIDGAAIILKRFSRDPWQYGAWYFFEKPHLLWDWDIRIGQGDIYVYPTRRDPFSNSPAWIAIYSICRAINFPLMLLALASVFFVCSKRSPLNSLDKQDNRSALVIVICLTAFVTTIYTALQAEPRYSIAFRPYEVLLAVSTLYALRLLWKKYKHPPLGVS
jgi:hypothetical protein